MPTEKELTDNLINECKNGNRNAFNELVLMYQDKVVSYAYGMLSNREDAYDAAQEIFIKIYKNISSFEGKAQFSTWLFRISSNVCKDILRKRQIQPVHASINSSDFEYENKDIEDTRYTPEGALEKSERQRTVHKALSEIKKEYREIIIYCDIEENSYEETAKILDCPVGTVKSRLSRARIALKKQLDKG